MSSSWTSELSIPMKEMPTKWFQYRPINVFPERGSDGITPGNFLKFNAWEFFKIGGLIPYPWDTNVCQKSPGRAFKFTHNFVYHFNLRSHPCVKVPGGSDFCWSNPQGIPLGENIFFIIFFIWVLWPIKIITLILSRVNQKVGRKRGDPRE